MEITSHLIRVGTGVLLRYFSKHIYVSVFAIGPSAAMRSESYVIYLDNRGYASRIHNLNVREHQEKHKLLMALICLRIVLILSGTLYQS